jgi:3-hydroxybutyryl-CoA dehydratase
MSEVSCLSLMDIFEGQQVCFDATITEEMIDVFAALTGDINPLHLDQSFARQKGYRARVVHGALLSGLVSRLVGVHLPGKNCLLHSMNMKFLVPVFAGDSLRVTGIVEQLSIAAKAMTIQVVIQNLDSQSFVSKGKVTVGFTEEG